MTGFNERAYRLDAWWRRSLRRRLLLVPWHRYQWRRAHLAYIPAFVRCADRKSPLRISIDLLVLAVRWRCAPMHYLRYGLYRRAHGWSAMLDHLPETVLYYRLLPRASADEILLDDKSVTKALLQTIGARTARTVGIVRDGDISWIEDIPTTRIWSSSPLAIQAAAKASEGCSPANWSWLTANEQANG